MVFNFRSLFSTHKPISQQEVFLRSAYFEIEKYISNEELEMADMAMREYLSKIDSANSYFSNALIRIRPHLGNSDKIISGTARTKLTLVQDELSVLQSWQKKSKNLASKLETAFKTRGKKDKSASLPVEKKSQVNKVSATSAPTPKKSIWNSWSKAFGITRKSSEDIQAFEEAVDWIKTYIAAKEYDKAILASRELLLKWEVGITYLLAKEKKVVVLASSNILTVSKNATRDLKEIKWEITLLMSKQERLRKMIQDCESKRAITNERLLSERIMLEIKQNIVEADKELKKSNFTEALHIARKLVAAHGEIKLVTDTLERIQKAYDKGSLKERKKLAEKNKRERFFREAGIPQEMPITGISSTDTSKPQSLIYQIFGKYFEANAKRRDYLQKQAVLKKIEKLLVQIGSITKIESADAESDILTIMESGLTKNISDFKIDGYEFFGKIIGKDKIVGDTFGHFKDGNKTVFYFGDATGHGIQAGFTVSQLTKIFYDQIKKRLPFTELFVFLNNELKSKLKGRVFVTGVFLEHDSTNARIRFIGAGHDPMFFYHNKTQTVEKIIPGGLAMGVRNITNSSSIKIKDVPFEDHDYLIGYTDGIIEARNSSWELYGTDRLARAIRNSASREGGSNTRLFQEIFQDVREFMGNEIFQDDVSIFIYRRDSGLDRVNDKAELESMIREFDLEKRTIKIDLHGKTRDEAREILAKERSNAELKARLTNMEVLFKLGEYGKLKQEITLCYKLGFVDARMNFFLEKILKNEDGVKLTRQEDRLQKEYEKIKSLYDKGEYGIVLRDTIDILYKNGNI